MDFGLPLTTQCFYCYIPVPRGQNIDKAVGILIISHLRAEICNICPIKGEVAGKENCSSKKYGVVVKDFEYEEEDFRKQGELHNGCGCFLYLKQRCMGCACPLGKWEAIVNKIESDKLETLYNE